MKILVLGTFPLTPARHGGQLRVGALIEAYRELGHEVEYLPVFCPRFYLDSPVPELSLTPGAATLERIEREPCLEDVFIGELAVHEPEARAKLARFLEEISPDVVQIEQPYLWASLKSLLPTLKHRPKVFYSSHNIEHLMKGLVYARELAPERAQEALRSVDQLDRELAQAADAVLAVTPSEAQTLKTWGARQVEVIINGATLPPTTDAALKSWQECLRPQPDRKWAFFVCSAHRPNLEGAENFLGPKLGYLAPHQRLVFAGGVCSLLDSSPLTGELAGAARARLTALGVLSNEALGALLRLTDLLVLPISAGAGSNLKTAQALLTDRPILATSFAFRGFEELKTAPGVFIADTPTEFREKLTQLLAVPTVAYPRSSELHAKLLWKKFAPEKLKAALAGLTAATPVSSHH